MKRLSQVLIMVLVLMVTGSCVYAITAEEILQDIYDRQNLSEGSFLIDMEIVITENDEVSVAQLEMYYYNESIQMLIFVAPEKLRNNCFLVIDSNIWMYKEGLHRPLRIPARQKIFGEAGIPETAGINYLNDYSVLEISRNGDYYLIKLEATDQKMAYQLIDLVVERDSQGVFQLKESTLYALSGQPLRKLTYDNFRKIGDFEVATINVQNLLQKINEKTKIEILNIKKRNFPKEAFQPGMMRKFNFLIQE